MYIKELSSTDIVLEFIFLKKSKNIFSINPIFQSTLNVIFASDLVSIVSSGNELKRESGENPEQSCCCVPPYNFPETTHATDINDYVGKALERE